MMRGLLVLVAVLLAGCAHRPGAITPVEHFDVARYLGTWYEIARMDHSFERGLSHVSVEYSLRPDGALMVVTRGYRQADGAWREAVGKACFVGPKDRGFLKASFFGPFYGAYIVFDLDRENYRHALVAGPDKSTLWLLARTPTLDEPTTKRLLAKAQAAGFDTSKLIFVHQDGAPAPRQGR